MQDSSCGKDMSCSGQREAHGLPSSWLALHALQLSAMCGSNSRVSSSGAAKLTAK
jgi:hypothetical protein